MGMWLRRHDIKLASFIFVVLITCIGVGTSWPTPLLEKQFHLADLDGWVGELPFDLESEFQIDFS